MRPIRLTIAGLHSFREPQEIDFDELAASGVFGIFGPTGSGKSTILDAITLALYGTVGRAEHNTRGILNHAEQQLSVSLSFEIGRGTSRSAYRVERSYKRKDELSVHNVRSRIIEERLDGDVVLADKDGEVTAHVKDILGLEPEDFTRAVVLPQGKFAEFLNLKGSDRNRMLQRLFSLHEYGDILTQKLKERADTTERQYEKIEALQQALGDASPEALELARAAVQAATQEELAAKDGLQQTRQQYDAAKQIWALQNELTQVEASLSTHQQSMEHISELKSKLECAERAGQVSPHLNVFLQAQQSHDELLRQLSVCEQTLGEKTKQLQTAQAYYQQVTDRRKTEEPKHLEQKVRLEAAAGIETDAARLKAELLELKSSYETQMVQYKEWQQWTHANDERMEQSRRQLHEVQRAMEESTVTVDERTNLRLAHEAAIVLERAKEDFSVAQEGYQTRLTQRATIENTRKQADSVLSTVRNEYADVTNRVNQLSEFSQARVEAEKGRQAELDKILQLSHQCQTAAERLAEATSSCSHLAERLTAVQTELQTHQSREAEILAAYQRAKDSHKAALTKHHQIARTLATVLVDGQPCPVCGSSHHPAPANQMELDEQHEDIEQIERQLLQFERSVELVAKQRMDAEKNVFACQADLDAQRVNQASRRQEADSLWAQMMQLSDSLNPSFRIPLEAHTSPAAVVEWVTNETERLETERKRLSEGMQSLDSAKQHRVELETKLARLEAEVDGCNAQLATAEAELGKASRLQSQAEATLAEAGRKFEITVELMAPYAVTQERPSREWVAAAVRDLDVKDTRLQEVRNLYEQCNTQLQQLLQEKETRAGQMQELGLSLASLKERHQTHKAALQEAREKLLALTGGQPISTVIRALNESVNALRVLEQQAEEQMKQIESERQAAETDRVRTQARLESLAGQRDAYHKALDEKLKEFGFQSPTEAEHALLSAEERDRIEHDTRVFEETRLQLSVEKSRLQNRLGEDAISEAEWAVLQDNLQAAEGRFRQAAGSFDVAVKTLEDTQLRHEQWQSMNTERASLAEEMSRLGMLKSLLSGNKFVEFLAQEQLDFVARQASERLQQLTRNRYGLELASDGRFVMRDDHNGGVKRPVSTLSGGETFLTSLALALSLSTQIQLRGKYPLEFFFLDEGFGTLDPELLDVVMSTLEKLHLEQMSIGVISHVPELRARMQRRLIVEPAEAAGRGTRVRLELA